MSNLAERKNSPKMCFKSLLKNTGQNATVSWRKMNTQNWVTLQKIVKVITKIANLSKYEVLKFPKLVTKLN